MLFQLTEVESAENSSDGLAVKFYKWAEEKVNWLEGKAKEYYNKMKDYFHK